jgi:hypothetical protein
MGKARPRAVVLYAGALIAFERGDARSFARRSAGHSCSCEAFAVSARRRTNLPAIDIEHVRVPAEHVACTRLEREEGNAPEQYIRGYGEWLFSETDLYAAITGKGPGLRSIDEVNAMLARLLGLRENARPRSLSTGASLPDLPAESTASADYPDEEQVAKSAGLPRALEELATDILTEGARRKLAATGKALTRVARAVVPSLKRFSDTMRDHLAPSQERELAEENAGELLDDERRELLARFEELERRTGK